MNSILQELHVHARHATVKIYYGPVEDNLGNGESQLWLPVEEPGSDDDWVE